MRDSVFPCLASVFDSEPRDFDQSCQIRRLCQVASTNNAFVCFLHTTRVRSFNVRPLDQLFVPSLPERAAQGAITSPDRYSLLSLWSSLPHCSVSNSKYRSLCPYNKKSTIPFFPCHLERKQLEPPRSLSFRQMMIEEGTIGVEVRAQSQHRRRGQEKEGGHPEMALGGRRNPTPGPLALTHLA